MSNSRCLDLRKSRSRDFRKSRVKIKQALLPLLPRPVGHLLPLAETDAGRHAGMISSLVPPWPCPVGPRRAPDPGSSGHCGRRLSSSGPVLQSA